MSFAPVEYAPHLVHATIWTGIPRPASCSSPLWSRWPLLAARLMHSFHSHEGPVHAAEQWLFQARQSTHLADAPLPTAAQLCDAQLCCCCASRLALLAAFRRWLASAASRLPFLVRRWRGRSSIPAASGHPVVASLRTFPAALASCHMRSQHLARAGASCGCSCAPRLARSSAQSFPSLRNLSSTLSPSLAY